MNDAAALRAAGWSTAAARHAARPHGDHCAASCITRAYAASAALVAVLAGLHAVLHW